jgi:protein O-GlcNAc transferase
MVHYHRYFNQLKKGDLLPSYHDEEDEDGENTRVYPKRLTTRTKIFFLLFLSLVSCSFVLGPHFIPSPSSISNLYSHGAGNEVNNLNTNPSSQCSSISNGTICCDRSAFRTDICFMKGDVRTNSHSSSILLYTSEKKPNTLINYISNGVRDRVTDEEIQHEKIKPYTRKWETSVMDTIKELHLVSKPRENGVRQNCDVSHDVPAVFFSTGGYTGNVYHEFNDGIIPLYITSQQFNRKVVFVIVEYHQWWFLKYRDILSRLSDYPVIDFNKDKRTHCFPEAIVGLRIHDELTVDPSKMIGNNKTIGDFRNKLLDRGYSPRIKGLIRNDLSPSAAQKDDHKPKLVILSRTGSRAITNENTLVKMAEKIGFQVEVFKPESKTELAKFYHKLNTSDVMLGVHGAAMTHLLFMRPGSVFIQIIPLGTVWAAETYYGEPARKLGLNYMDYKILPRESSLYDSYDEKDPVLTDPDSVANKGWQITKKVYLDNQTVRLNLQRFRKYLVRAHQNSKSKSTIRHSSS